MHKEVLEKRGVGIYNVFADQLSTMSGMVFAPPPTSMYLFVQLIKIVVVVFCLLDVGGHRYNGIIQVLLLNLFK